MGNANRMEFNSCQKMLDKEQNILWRHKYHQTTLSFSDDYELLQLVTLLRDKLVLNVSSCDDFCQMSLLRNPHCDLMAVAETNLPNYFHESNYSYLQRL
jgi:hypothetical protein